MSTNHRSPDSSSDPLIGMPADGAGRLYQKLASALFHDLAAGKYKIGDRLPAERELAAEYSVSRPAVREAMIALEVQGLIEVRIGSGAYVRHLPGSEDRPDFHATAFELTEARLLFEGEAAALAATTITDDEVRELEKLVAAIGDKNASVDAAESADYAFHTLIARASRNVVITKVIEQLWQIRSSSPECALLHEKARRAGSRPVVEEHKAIVDALKRRDAADARGAMRTHLNHVIDYLLVETEEQAIAKARQSVASTRERFGRSAAL